MRTPSGHIICDSCGLFVAKMVLFTRFANDFCSEVCADRFDLVSNQKVGMEGNAHKQCKKQGATPGETDQGIDAEVCGNSPAG